MYRNCNIKYIRYNSEAGVRKQDYCIRLSIGHLHSMHKMNIKVGFIHRIVLCILPLGNTGLAELPLLFKEANMRKIGLFLPASKWPAISMLVLVLRGEELTIKESLLSLALPLCFQQDGRSDTPQHQQTLQQS